QDSTCRGAQRRLREWEERLRRLAAPDRRSGPVNSTDGLQGAHRPVDMEITRRGVGDLLPGVPSHLAISGNEPRGILTSIYGSSASNVRFRCPVMERSLRGPLAFIWLSEAAKERKFDSAAPRPSGAVVPRTHQCPASQKQ